MILTDQQEKASMHFKGPALVLAVPGAGKTTVLIKRIENLIQKYDINPKNILSITFSKSQALDMEIRYKNSRPDSEMPRFSTIHAFAYDIIRAYNRDNKRNLRLIEGHDFNKYSLVKRLYYNLNENFITDDSLEEFFTSLTFIKNCMMDLDRYIREYKPQIKGFRELFLNYENYKRLNNFIDFDDMLTMAYEIIKKEDNILNRIRNLYKYIQIDEAQDTSLIQLRMIELIAKPEDNIFMVADDDQSIYGFRGAVPAELLSFKRKYPNGKIFFMEDNHRSYKDIVYASNKFIKTNENRYKKDIKTTNDISSPIKVVTAKNIDAEHRYLIKNIKRDIDEEKEVAVLYRNNISAMTLMDSFQKAGIPFYVKDKRNYLSHFVIKDILNILKLSKDTSDIDLYESVYYKLGAYLRKDYLNHLQYDSSISVFDSLLEIPGLKDFQIDRILQLKHSFKRLAKLNIDRGIEYIENNLGYGEYLDEKVRKSGSGGFSPSIILESLKYISKDLKSPYELEEKLENLKNLKTFKFPNTVVLSTIHSAKGLEYDSVYLIDLVQGEFPSKKSTDIDPRGVEPGIEEERRLFYVAMTRAKSNLCLISLKTRNNSPVKRSEFFNSIKKMKS
ncbi:MAG: ATP-dependent helicase [Tissierellia bacterium]|nr:ATP-dependent helicase [Tissierellia bacterium]